MTIHRYEHGSPEDRGSADSWYRRPRRPHYWPEGTGHGEKIDGPDMTSGEIAAYHAGYTENEAAGGHKQY